MLKIEIDPRYPQSGLDDCAMLLALLRDVVANSGHDGLDLTADGAGALVTLLCEVVSALRQIGAALPPNLEDLVRRAA